MVDIRGDNRPSGGYLLANEFARDGGRHGAASVRIVHGRKVLILAYGYKLHLGRHNALLRVLPLRYAGPSLRAARPAAHVRETE